MSKRGRPPHPDILTPREWEVLALLRLGLSNPEIAERLGISRDGAKYHVSQILGKLGLESREQVARWQYEDAQPWWATTFTPLGSVWRQLSPASGVAARAALVVVILAAVGGLGLLALLLFMQSDDGDDALVGQTPAPSSAQLSYVDEAGTLWLVNADGSDRRKLADDVPCGVQMQWSPAGEILLCQGGAGVLLDSAGKVVGEAPNFGVRGAHWSPSGEFLLHALLPEEVPQTIELHLSDKKGILIAKLGSWITGSRPVPPPYLGAALWGSSEDNIFYTSEETGEIFVYTATTGESRVVGQGHRPMAWALGGRALVVASNEEVPAEFKLFGSYEVNLLETTTGELTRLSVLDSYTQFWISPDGEKAVYTIPGFAPVEGGTVPGLGVLDLTTGESASIPGSIITFPSEGIPIHFVQFSPDNEFVY